MAKLNISNKNKPLPILKSFKASKPIDIISCDANELSLKYTYYYEGIDSEPKIGDIIFTDINGQIPYNDKLFLQFKKDSNRRYFYKIENNVIKDIEFCKIIDFKEVEILDQTEETICEENSFFPDDLTENAEIFYHDGNGEFPSLDDKIYLTEDRTDTLNNFVGLFNILNDTYYYLKTNNTGVVERIKTCKEIISIPTRSSTLRPHRLNEDLYNIFLCDKPSNNLTTIYYKSESEGLPEEGTLIYSDSNLNNLVTKSSYYVSYEKTERNEITITSLLVNENGEASYVTCIKNIIIEEPAPNPQLGVFYFNVILGIDFCKNASSNDTYTKIYYQDDIETGANFVRPKNGTTVFLDEQLNQPYNSSTDGIYGYLYKDFSNNTVTYAIFSGDKIQGTRICNIPSLETGDGELGTAGENEFLL